MLAFSLNCSNHHAELPTSEFIINNGKKITSNATVHVSQGELLFLECVMNGGNPDTQSTTISCEFPINQSGMTSETKDGTALSLKITANSSMNGKTCRCWGNHIAGNTDYLTLTWKVACKSFVGIRYSECQTFRIIAILLSYLKRFIHYYYDFSSIN